MEIIISNSSSIPIYEQIKNEIKKQIMNGTLSPNEALPSIRSLAQDIHISIMTIKKSYDELEQEGYIITRQGKGSFVAESNTELKREEAKKEIESYMIKMIELASRYGVSLEEVEDLFIYLIKEERK